MRNCGLSGISADVPVRKRCCPATRGEGRLPYEIIGQEAGLPLPGIIDVGRLERVMVEI